MTSIFSKVLGDKNRRRFIIILLLGSIGIPASYFAFRFFEQYISFAGPQEMPERIQTTNITDSSFTVSWITPQAATTGYIEYSQSSNFDASSFAYDDKGTTGDYYTHHVTVQERLDESSNYYFRIYTGGAVYENYIGEVKTAATPSAAPSAPRPIFGNTQENVNNDAIVYASVTSTSGESAKLSSLVRTSAETGNSTWVMDLSNLFTLDLQERFTTRNSDRLTLELEGGSLGRTDRTILAGNDIPVLSFTSAPEEPEIPEEPFVEEIPLTVSEGISIPAANVESLRLSNITENTFTISWITQDPTTGYLEYGFTSDLGFTRADDRDANISLAEERYTHTITVTVTDLAGVENLYYRIWVDGIPYDQGGAAQ